MLGMLAGCSAPDGGSEAPIRGTGVGIAVESMDKAVAPGEDFYLYANGTWLRTAEIPADRTSIGAGSATYDRTQERLKGLIEGLAAKPQEEGTAGAIVAAYYKAFTDTAAIDKAGFGPVRGDLDRFAAIADLSDLSRVIGEQLRADVDPYNATDFATENLFGVFVTKSLGGSEVIPYLLQGGLGMPDREYYLSSDPDMAAARTAYRAYIARVLRLAGFDRVATRSEAVFALETKIAAAHMTRAQSYDMARRTQEWAPGDFARKAPGMDWAAFFDAAQLGGAKTISVYHETSIPALSVLVASEPLEAWKDWLAFHQISSHAEVLPAAVREAHFAFAEKTISGRRQARPRNELAVDAMDGILGQALGKLYVDRYFSDGERRDIAIMVGRIKAAFADRIENDDWMAPETRREALAKVRSMEIGIGRPEAFEPFDGLNLQGRSAYAMTVLAEQAWTARQLVKIGKPLNRGEWWMDSHIVNALNLPLQNALNFPAAILQKPFYDPEADAAFNYGAIGSIIGHEVVHSFDNVGAEFDSAGNMRNWWTDKDKAVFAKRGAALARQYGEYRPFPDLAIDGERTLAENIADLAGLQAAYDAYHASLGGKEPPVIEGFTGDQRFFIAFAQSWASKRRRASLRNLIMNDGHTPDRYRALTVRNLDTWYRAFDVQEGAALYLAPDQRVHIF